MQYLAHAAAVGRCAVRPICRFLTPCRHSVIIQSCRNHRKHICWQRFRKRCGFLTAQPDSEHYVRELRQVQVLLERLLSGRECRWNGNFVPVNYLLTWGQIQWDEARASCAICVDRGVLSTEARWIVYFHEMLHAFSTGAEEPGVYFGLRGWEEGLVETLERLLRPELVQELGLQFSAPVLEEIRQYESLNNYNRYVRALEAISQEAGYDTGAWRTFLIELLSTPLLDRSYQTITSANAALQSFPIVERNRRLAKIAAACQELYGGTG